MALDLGFRIGHCGSCLSDYLRTSIWLRPACLSGFRSGMAQWPESLLSGLHSKPTCLHVSAVCPIGSDSADMVSVRRHPVASVGDQLDGDNGLRHFGSK